MRCPDSGQCVCVCVCVCDESNDSRILCTALNAEESRISRFGLTNSE